MRKCMIAINMVIFVGCAVYLWQYYKEGQDVVEKVDEVKELIVQEEEETPQKETKVVTKPQVDKSGKLVVLSKFKKALKKYPDLIGWVTIDGLLDYPVMQTSLDDPLYYLYRNVDGEDSKPGTPYMDARCDIGKPSDNFILYAHNMKNLSMFGWLAHYNDKAFYKEHPIIKFDNLYFTGQYEIFAAFYGEYFGDDEKYADEFKYYEFINAKNKKQFNSYIKNIKKMSLYDTGVDVSYGDQLLTLSTCNHTGGKENGRFVVVARLKRSDSNADKGNKLDLDNNKLHEIIPTNAPETETPKPTDKTSEDPDKTKKPKKTKKPVKTKKPEATKKAKDTKEPEETKKPDSTKKPDKTKKPETTKEPDETKTPKATKKPKATKEPDKTKAPEKTKEPEKTKKPEDSKETKEPDDGTHDNSGENTDDNTSDESEENND